MNERRSLRDRFWASRSWPWWKQLLVAGAVLAAVGAVLSLFTHTESAGTSLSTDPPRLVAVGPTTDDPSLVGTAPPASMQTIGPTTEDPSTTENSTDALSQTPSDGSALSILATIPVGREHRGGYDRDLFAIWLDLDGDGCDTRQEVFIAESLNRVEPPTGGCTVPEGEWYSVYDGATTTEPSTFDIDHVVSLKEAWDSGAWNWEPSRRIAFGNDLTDTRTLVAVSAVSNRSKGDADPSNWLPMPNQICQYISDWVSIKARWSLSMDESEYGRIRNLLQGDCQGTEVPSWLPAP